MKKTPLYLIFFALTYSLMKFLSIRDLILVPCLVIIIEGVFITCIYLLCKDWLRAGFITLLIFSWALYFGIGGSYALSIFKISYNLTNLLLFLLVWTLVIYIVGSSWSWRKIKSPQTLTLYSNIVTLVFTIISSYRLIVSITHIFFTPIDLNTTGSSNEVGKYDKPDIYYIILDGYGRKDTLKEYLNFDNSQFINFLESRGFYIADQSQANYLYTINSISSSLNMNYINPTSQPMYQMAYTRLISENQARSYLAGLGYHFVTFYSPFLFTDITNADIYYPIRNSTEEHIARIEEALFPGSLGAIPLEAGIAAPSGNYEDYQKFILSSIHELTQIPYIPGPKFIFLHILAPHPPYVFDQNGPITPEKPYLLVRDFRGTFDDRISGYIDQACYISIQIESAIDEILKNSITPPIIIIQGDHGPGMYFTRTCQIDRAAILNAYYLPDLSTNNPIYPTITPVNTFRLIFNSYFGAHFDLLSDKVYMLMNVESTKFFDVTEESKQNCVLP